MEPPSLDSLPGPALTEGLPVGPDNDASPGKKTSLGGLALKALLLVALFGLAARLVVSGFFLASDNPLAILQTSPPAEASPAPAAEAVSSGAAALSAMAGSAVMADAAAAGPALLSASAVSASAAASSASAAMTAPASLAASGAGMSSLLMGAASLTGSAALAAAAADPAIPLAPGDEDLTRPQRPPSARAAPAANGSAAPAAARPANPPLAPNAANQSNAREEELSRREFELNRRAAMLDTREEALRNLQAGLDSKLALSERAKTEMEGLVARNQAILDEQKAVREQQRQEEEQLKDARIEHLVAAFKSMKPEQAGVLISSMDDLVAVSILSAMPGSNAGKILAMVTPDKAARLVKSISEQRIDPKAILQAAPLAQQQPGA
jgi:flagellar motility protein MotE (MotC chaperone)